MNTNTYPAGRWTATSRSQPSPSERIPNAFTQLDIQTARLSELFWTTPEAELLCDAVDRLDRRLRLTDRLPDSGFEDEIARAA